MAHMGWAVATPQECRCWKPLRGGGERLWKSRSVETQRQGSHCAWKSRKGRGIPTFPQPRRRVLYVELESGHITCYKNRTSSRANNSKGTRERIAIEIKRHRRRRKLFRNDTSASLCL